MSIELKVLRQSIEEIHVKMVTKEGYTFYLRVSEAGLEFNSGKEIGDYDKNPIVKSAEECFKWIAEKLDKKGNEKHFKDRKNVQPRPYKTPGPVTVVNKLAPFPLFKKGATGT